MSRTLRELRADIAAAEAAYAAALAERVRRGEVVRVRLYQHTEGVVVKRVEGDRVVADYIWRHKAKLPGGMALKAEDIVELDDR